MGTVFEMFLHSSSPDNWGSSVKFSRDVLLHMKYSSSPWSAEIIFSFSVGTLNVQIYASQSFVMSEQGWILKASRSVMAT